MEQLQRTLRSTLDLFFDGMATMAWQSVSALFIIALGMFTFALRSARTLLHPWYRH